MEASREEGNHDQQLMDTRTPGSSPLLCHRSALRRTCPRRWRAWCWPPQHLAPLGQDTGPRGGSRRDAELGSCPRRERRQQGAQLQPAIKRASAANPEQVHPSALGGALNGCGEPGAAHAEQTEEKKKNKRKREERSRRAAPCCMESTEQPRSCLGASAESHRGRSPQLSHGRARFHQQQPAKHALLRASSLPEASPIHGALRERSIKAALRAFAGNVSQKQGGCSAGEGLPCSAHGISPPGDAPRSHGCGACWR